MNDTLQCRGSIALGTGCGVCRKCRKELCAAEKKEMRKFSNDWMPIDCGTVDTPFNLEEILRACPALLRKWKEHPFILDVNEGGRVVVVYV